MSTRKAFFIHLAISATVVGAVLALIFLVWYPEPFFAAQGAWRVVRVLVFVDLIVGPVLTLMLYRPGKWGARFDLCVIALVQLTALAYGVSVVYKERPYFMVFAVDRFELVAESQVDLSRVDYARTGPKGWGPLRVFAPIPPEGPERQQLLEEVLFKGAPDIELRPERYVAFSEALPEIRRRAKPLAELVGQYPDLGGRIERLRRDYGDSRLGFLPLKGKVQDLAVVLELEQAELLAGFAVDPWFSLVQTFEEAAPLPRPSGTEDSVRSPDVPSPDSR